MARGAGLALGLLTALNFLNYVDRNILFAVQPQIQQEFHTTDAQLGALTSRFFIGYILTAPLFGWLADRYPRRLIMAAGALVWSGATLLTAFTHSYDALLFRHTVVGVGEASFAAIGPAFLADLFDENQRGRMLAFFNVALPLGAACGYVLGGKLGAAYGWRAPFYVGALPGAILGIAVAFLPEPERGRADHLDRNKQRASLRGLWRNAAFWTASLGMAMLTFSEGGLQVWMPTFLVRVRQIELSHADLMFGLIVGFNGIIATLIGGWLGDRMYRRRASAHYWLSGVAMALGIAPMLVAIYGPGSLVFPAIFVSTFMLFLNTGPLNAAIVNAVAAPIRATALALNIFLIHLLGDVPSPRLMGYISDRTGSLPTAFIPAVVATALSAAVLFYGARFAPRMQQRT